jgi:collagen beta-1,O-galactosyltransferase
MKAYVLNLKRRPDRLAHMQAVLPPELDAEYTTNWDIPMDGQTMDDAALEPYGLFPWQIESDNKWWRRPLKKGEVGCAIGHWACWQRALRTKDDVFLFFEDDIVPVEGFTRRLTDGLQRLANFDPDWGLLYLGRHGLEPDEPALDGIVRPGFSYCTYGYALTRAAITKVLTTAYDQAIIPADELLPALYLDHPREDVRQRYPKLLRAYAFEPPLVTQLSRDIAGTDTEDSDFIGAPPLLF